jgi:FtsP/CotA-like multicopper oxidase with cupredoxin domain
MPRRRGCLASLAIVIAVGFGGLMLLSVGGFAFAWVQASVDTSGEVDFSRRLTIPPLAPSTVDENGRRVFSLLAQEGTADLGGDDLSHTWGFNGDYLGPTLRAERGEEVAVRITNELPEATSVHWHGMHLPAAMDGGPHQAVEPGETWEPTWRIDQPATTLWYHPHPHGQSADHVARGLAGMFILDGPEEQALPLPRTYGVDDLPVIVQDKDVRGNGNLGSGTGRTIVVNGTVEPYAVVSSERVRLRLLNASTTRVFDFRLDNDEAFGLIGTDGGLLPAPVWTDHIRLSPGERAEIVVTMAPGERRVLRSERPDLGGNLISNHFEGGGAVFDVLQLRAAERLEPSPELPERLSTTNLATAGEETEAALTRSFVLNGRSINGRRMDMGRIDFGVDVGQTEVWAVVNDAGSAHSFHVHDVQFRVLSVDGRGTPPDLGGLKDTVYLEPKRRYRLLMRFTDHTDPDRPYMFHCHLLRHEDEGMMGQFVVTEPGAEVGHVAQPAAPHTSHAH